MKPAAPGWAGLLSAAVLVLAPWMAAEAAAGDLPAPNPAGTSLCCKTGRSGMTFLAPLRYAPFPFHGRDPDTGRDFLDPPVPADQNSYRTAPSGRRYPERGYYDESKVLFHLPPDFDPSRPVIFLVYLAPPGKKVAFKLRETRILDQVEDSKTNTVLVAPQLSLAEDDPSPGKFSQAGVFQSFLTEVGETLRREMSLKDQGSFERAPVILAAHRGGDKAAAWIMAAGGAPERISGVLLLAPDLEEPARLADWLAGRWPKTWFAAITAGAGPERLARLTDLLKAAAVPFTEAGPAEPRPGTAAVLRVETDPSAVPLLGPPEQPIAFFLSRAAGEDGRR